MPRRKKLVKVFLDSSVVFSAFHSDTGGSMRIVREAFEYDIRLVISPRVIEEAVSSLTEKYPHTVPLFPRWLEHAKFSIVPKPSPRLVKQFEKIIASNDAPILAAAQRAKADVLVTLDRKDFIDNVAVRKAQLPFTIFTPGDFIKKYFDANL